MKTLKLDRQPGSPSCSSERIVLTFPFLSLSLPQRFIIVFTTHSTVWTHHCRVWTPTENEMKSYSTKENQIRCPLHHRRYWIKVFLYMYIFLQNVSLLPKHISFSYACATFDSPSLNCDEFIVYLSLSLVFCCVSVCMRVFLSLSSSLFLAAVSICI